MSTASIWDLKQPYSRRLWFDLGLFYYDYLNFQTSAWVADASTGEFNYIVKDGGKASGYGAEANVKYAVLKGLQIFGNYAYIHARFAENDVDGARTRIMPTTCSDLHLSIVLPLD